jgi:hypothetical protein
MRKYVLRDIVVSSTYLGFSWDLDNKTVSIGPRKCSKYLARLATWLPGSSFTKLEVQKVIGTLNHCSVILVEGRSRLPTLYQMVSSFKSDSSPFVKHRPTSRALIDIEWWCNELSRPWCGTHIRKIPEPLPSQIFVDASTSWGIGFMWEDHWMAWKLIPGWKSEGRDIGWAEMVAVELAYLTVIASGLSNCHFIIHSDNQGMVGTLKNDSSRNPEQNVILRRIISYTQAHGIWLTTRWVPSEENLADKPSRGIFPPTSLLYPHRPKIPFKLRPFVSPPVYSLPSI